MATYTSRHTHDVCSLYSADRLFEQKPIGRWEATEAHGELGGEALVDRAPFLREVVHKVGAYGRPRPLV